MYIPIIYKLVRWAERCRITYLCNKMNVGNKVTIKAGFQASRPKKITINDNVSIHTNCTFQAQAPITIGSGTMIAANCTLVTANHEISINDGDNHIGEPVKAPITIGENCWLGTNVTILPGVTIHSGAVIAAASVVTRDMPANMICMGTPAKPVKERPLA